jgi:hypothetical protein
MSGIICFLRYLRMKITCAMRDAISTTRVMSRAGLRGRLGNIDGVRLGRLVQAPPVMGMSALDQKRTHAPQQASLFGAPN